MKTIQIVKAQIHKCVFCKASKLFYSKLLIGSILSFLFFDYYFGILIKLKEKDYFTEFDFPVFGDTNVLIGNFNQGEVPENAPYKNHNYTFLITNQDMCLRDKGSLKKAMSNQPNIDLVIFVKSAAPNFDKRDTIRKSWGGKTRLKDVQIQTLFTLGASKDIGTQDKIREEDNRYKDLIQGDFTDAYFNNTIKTLMSFQWAYKFCDNAKYYFFVDDDYYVSTKNLLLFLKNPTKYEEYAQIENHETRNTYKNDLLGKVIFLVPTTKCGMMSKLK